LWLRGRAALMKAGAFVAVGPALDVITDSNLSATYDTDVRVFTVAGGDGAEQWPMCSPWHS
jgi:ABC-type cobalamin transport system ATPase subunit